ncbi:unnamed protein product [Pieris macdunnoughi]|uniref:Uncharacterized protein n=1 Tax=Pieris macdunnoughi TaxID=345717 RepID=A0A821QI03_9NEOP|nr:unnamed protein product [Pieris macdunnoughi]
MKDISDEIMLCFVQATRDRDNRDVYNKNIDTENENTKGKSKTRIKRAAVVNDLSEAIDSEVELRDIPLSKGRSLRLSSGEKILKKFPDVKRSFSDRFSVISDTSGKKAGKGILTIRKTW